jgi:hypothetical protein
MVTISGMTEHYRKAFGEDQAKVLAEATVLIEADLVRREDFSKLTATVERLAEAQERTEQRMDSLANRMDRLAAAQEPPSLPPVARRPTGESSCRSMTTGQSFRDG